MSVWSEKDEQDAKSYKPPEWSTPYEYSQLVPKWQDSERPFKYECVKCGFKFALRFELHHDKPECNNCRQRGK